MRFFIKKIQDWILKSERIRKRILSFMVYQRNRRSHSGNGFFGFFDAPRSERSWINLFNKETQNPFSYFFGFKNPILDFLKETHPEWLKHFFSDPWIVWTKWLLPFANWPLLETVIALYEIDVSNSLVLHFHLEVKYTCQGQYIAKQNRWSKELWDRSQ